MRSRLQPPRSARNLHSPILVIRMHIRLWQIVLINAFESESEQY